MSEESTTPDLVELERLGWSALDRGELGVYFRPDVVMDIAGYGMGTFDGREAAIGFLQDWISSFEDLTIEPDEIVDLGNGVGLTVYHQEGRPIGSTNYVRVRSAIVTVWENGAVVSMMIYPEPDIDEARAAAERLAADRG
jgi:ketosteroid isomerase-like protein